MNAKTWHAIRFDPTQKPEPGTCEIDYGHPLAQGLSGFWPFNEGGRLATDLSGSKASIINGAVWQDTIRGRCLSFNGSSDYVPVVPYVPKGDRTFAAWVRLTSAASFAMVVSASTAGAETELRFSSTTQKPEWNSQNGAATVVAPSALILGTWHSICGTTCGLTVSLYVDGIFVGSAAHATQPLAITGARIGSRPSGSNFFAGNIDSPVVYRRGLLASEVGWLYAEPYAMLRPVSRVTYSIPSVSGLLLKRRRMFAA